MGGEGLVCFHPGFMSQLNMSESSPQELCRQEYWGKTALPSPPKWDREDLKF